jgi:hypothetical protein
LGERQSRSVSQPVSGISQPCFITLKKIYQTVRLHSKGIPSLADSTAKLPEAREIPEQTHQTELRNGNEQEEAGLSERASVGSL